MPEGQSLRKPCQVSGVGYPRARHTFVPLLQLLLVKVGGSLEFAQLLWGELGLPMHRRWIRTKFLPRIGISFPGPSVVSMEVTALLGQSVWFHGSSGDHASGLSWLIHLKRIPKLPTCHQKGSSAICRAGNFWFGDTFQPFLCATWGSWKRRNITHDLPMSFSLFLKIAWTWGEETAKSVLDGTERVCSHGCASKTIWPTT